MKNLIWVIILYIFFLWNSFSYYRDLEGIDIISRWEWMADDKYLFKDYEEYKEIIKYNEVLNHKIEQNPEDYKSLLEERAKNKEREKYLLENWPKEVKADKVLSKINWKELWWNLAYKNNKTKIIIHHTASSYTKNKNIEDVKKYIRWIYYYQAIKRWWWDIGYNFIIDQFWNIYEWRKGWEGIIWAHTKRNNVPSIWIALIWHFDNEKPTDAQIDSLIKLASSLAKKYSIDPYKKQIYHMKSSEYPYIKDVENYSIIWHKDAGHTACPGRYLYDMLDFVRKKVKENLYSIQFTSYKKQTKTLNLSYKFTLKDSMILKVPWAESLQNCSSSSNSFIVTCNDNKIYLKYKNYEAFWTKTIKAEWKNYIYTINFKPLWMDDIRYLMKERAKNYIWDNINSHNIQKISYKNYKDNVQNLIDKWISVLLYELSWFTYFDIYCDNSCIVKTPSKTYYNVNSLKVDKVDPLIVWIKDKSISTKSLSIKDTKWWLVYFKNYSRKSYVWIPWNNFHGEIVIKKDYIKPIWQDVDYRYVVINNVSFKDYIAWIAESNDQMPIEKIKVMALLAKSYVLFYANKKNEHPSIPSKSSYNAVDDPRIFQKYVWAWYEKTSKLWKQALSDVENELIFYEDYIPILPYFSCSPGFTYSWKQKFGWNDTPYLVNNIDLWKCNNFVWHGVWLSWKWAEYLANKWLNYKQIIEWYYPWTNIEKY